MRLAYLEYFHRGVFISGIIAALFMGMAFQYNIRQAEIRGEERGVIKAYMGTSLRGLSEISI